MFEKIKSYLLPVLIATSALSVSASAAFYSVSGLSKLFAGASLQVIIMASSLEVAKLVIASLLYQYWNEINKVLRAYLTVAAAVLILITSMGIYGFLSAAYQETANKAGNIDAQISLVEVKRDNVKDQLTVYNTEKSTINGAISDLRAGLANNVIQYKDKDGNLITTTSSATRRALEKQLDQAVERQTEINSKVDELNEQLFAYETEIVNIQTGNDLAGELGPLKYLSGLTGMPMDKIINILLLVIIFVFDPLAISLVVAANFAFARLIPKTKETIYGEKKVIDDDGMWTEEEMQDFNNQFNVDDLLPDEEEDWEEEDEDLPNEVIDEILKGEVFEIEDWKIEDEEKENLKFNEFDIDKDGRLSAEEQFLKEQIEKLKQDKSIGDFRLRREIERLKKEFKIKHNLDDDLTITY